MRISRLDIELNNVEVYVSSAIDAHSVFAPGQLFDGRFIVEKVVKAAGKEKGCTTGGGTSASSCTAVYQAFDKAKGRSIIIKHFKQTPGASNTLSHRFVREAQALAAVDHQAVVKLLEFRLISEHESYLVMNQVEGLTLEEHIAQNGMLTYHAVVALFSQILEALSVVHKNQIIHRDIKPANIIVTQPPSIEAVKLVDFGIARMPAPQDKPMKLTLNGDLLGSPLYMSPEQCMGDDIDQRTDIYSLGCVMYESLTGAPPFGGTHTLALMTKQVMEQPAAILKAGAIETELVAQLGKIVLKAMAKAPADRYQSADEMLADLLKIEKKNYPDHGKNGALHVVKDLIQQQIICLTLLLPSVVAIFFVYNNSRFMGAQCHTVLLLTIPILFFAVSARNLVLYFKVNNGNVSRNMRQLSLITSILPPLIGLTAWLGLAWQVLGNETDQAVLALFAYCTFLLLVMEIIVCWYTLNRHYARK